MFFTVLASFTFLTGQPLPSGKGEYETLVARRVISACDHSFCYVSLQRGYDRNAKELTALMVEPGKHPKVTKIKDDLDSLQKAVSIGADYQGLIEFVSLGNGDCIMCNEEGKLIGLDGNRRLGNDILVGVFYGKIA